MRFAKEDLFSAQSQGGRAVKRQSGETLAPSLKDEATRKFASARLCLPLLRGSWDGWMGLNSGGWQAIISSPSYFGCPTPARCAMRSPGKFKPFWPHHDDTGFFLASGLGLVAGFGRPIAARQFSASSAGLRNFTAATRTPLAVSATVQSSTGTNSAGHSPAGALRPANRGGAQPRHTE
ncbi:uncharacterized protein TRIVIDRAFT_207309 [Trichoderma virens Gv29-8]|uniref:Uncharacterized protein n=1 Tax=Hypocrea virens (strain Gv29-8 / FGSC 10586) TaxID=413071 RepID=G9ND13_HYPVG|nr:uncharacterized protein TRIVIDRAFT_207309 [Trichoderma virens Gv29-8]EHK15582.1 hypothetical protein TRIVIDRAFT_207309 [Trichoderma virens Gv29-8]